MNTLPPRLGHSLHWSPPTTESGVRSVEKQWRWGGGGPAANRWTLEKKLWPLAGILKGDKRRWGLEDGGRRRRCGGGAHPSWSPEELFRSLRGLQVFKKLNDALFSWRNCSQRFSFSLEVPLQGGDKFGHVFTSATHFHPPLLGTVRLGVVVSTATWSEISVGGEPLVRLAA